MMNLRKATPDGFEMINREIIAGDAHLNTNMQKLNAYNIDFFSPTILAERPNRYIPSFSLKSPKILIICQPTAHKMIQVELLQND